jgi:hypothetical protein
MVRDNRFSMLLPVAQSVLTAIFGGLGLWQRSMILSRPFLEGQLLWDTTARFHVWPWPYKFAVILSMPAFVGGMLVSWLVSAFGLKISEVIQIALFFVLVPALWYWVGSRVGSELPSIVTDAPRIAFE